ncbi:MAG: hypothetical protein ACPGWR_12810, partial [Ardenticatenaceae bacterium]
QLILPQPEQASSLFYHKPMTISLFFKNFSDFHTFCPLHPSDTLDVGAIPGGCPRCRGHPWRLPSM